MGWCELTGALADGVLRLLLVIPKDRAAKISQVVSLGCYPDVPNSDLYFFPRSESWLRDLNISEL